MNSPLSTSPMRRFACLAALALAGCVMGTQPADEQPAPPTPAQILADPSQPTAAFTQAARQLAASPTDNQSEAALVAVLASDDHPAAARVAAAAALTPRHTLDRPLGRALILMTRAGAPDLRAAAAAPLAAYRTRESARRLAELAADTSPAVRAAAVNALRRFTGRDDLGFDPAAWIQWERSQRDINDRRWRELLAETLAGRTHRLAAQLSAAEAELVAAYRRLHLTIDPAERSDLLITLLEHRAPALRALGFELAAREIAASNDIAPGVGQAALALLTHTDPTTRADAARLVNRLAPVGADQSLRAALEAETNADAAASQLQALVRWPTPAAMPAIIRWLAGPAPTSRAAVEAAAAIARAGSLTQPHAAEVLAHLRSILPEDAGPAALRLRARLGDETDIPPIAELLQSTDDTRRRAAAAALATSPLGVAPLLLAAATDPALSPLAALAVRDHQPNAQSLLALAALPFQSVTARSTQLVITAAALPLDELIAAAVQTDPATAILLLTRLLTDPASDHPDHTRGLLLLATLQLAAAQPQAALNAADRVTPPADAVETRLRVNRIRLLALVKAGRLDEATQLAASPAVWLESLAHAPTPVAALRLLDHIEATFTGKLSAQEQAQLTKARAALAPPPEG